MDKNTPLESLDLVRLALRDQRLTPMQRVLLAEICTHNQARFVPRIAVLAKEVFGTSDRRTRDSVRKHLRNLESLRVLKVRYTDQNEIARYIIRLSDAERASGDALRASVTTRRQRQGDAAAQGLRGKGSTKLKRHHEGSQSLKSREREQENADLEALVAKLKELDGNE